jgi:hypothetical protein
MFSSQYVQLSICSVVKTKRVMVKSRINEGELKEIGEGNKLAN